MLKELSVNFGNVLLSCSTAIDLADESIADHQIRVAFIAWQLAKASQISPDRVEQIFIGALLHDVGALTSDEKEAIHSFELEDMNAHSIRGANLLYSSPLLREASSMVRFHHRPWSKCDTDITIHNTFAAQILYLADYLERSVDRKKYILHQNKDIAEKIVSMKGKEIHPDIVELLKAISAKESFWLDMMSPRLYDILSTFGPFRNLMIDTNSMFSIAPFFRNLVDFRSRFTATHSSGVSECAAMISQYFGFTKHECSLMDLAGCFHDIGKLAVPNSILEKPGKLTGEEFAVIRKHTYYSYVVLSTIGGLEEMAEWAAFHHEKLDGTGYPFHVGRDKLSTLSRIMAVADTFTALSEDRPYREGMNKTEMENIFLGMVKRNALDERITKILFKNYDEIALSVKCKQAIARDEFERIALLH
ncbi:MAG: HD domain-containing phosphohydrolase [Nitrospinota bacterium]|nr:HD domain-containing protein [Nitrospinota bacterium]